MLLQSPLITLAVTNCFGRVIWKINNLQYWCF